MDARNEVVQAIVKQLEQGIIPWHKPWWGGKGAYSRVTGKSYSLLNQMLLDKPGEYLTFKQINELGGKVKKGEKAKTVVFWTFFTPKKDTSAVNDSDTDDGKDDDKKMEDTIPCLKSYKVFHIDQTEGIDKKYDFEKKFDTYEDEECEMVVLEYFGRESIRVNREDNGNRACYSVVTDTITIPSIKQFERQEEYYNTLYHETVLSTGAKGRLERDGIISRSTKGSELYAKEELIAELGAASLLHTMGMSNEYSTQNSAAYIQKCLDAIKKDKNLIISAAGKAEKAVDFILGQKVS